MWSSISQEDVCPIGGTTRLTMLYDPTEDADRLVLGSTGMMSEAEFSRFRF
jgi:hypothetical protein